MYIKSRLPNTHIQKAPFEALTGKIPDITNLRIFGSRLHTKKPGKRDVKLDHHSFNGVFFGYMATTKNFYYINDTAHNVKIGTPALFDEAHFTVDSKRAPLASEALQHLGYSNFGNKYKDGVFIPDAILCI